VRPRDRLGREGGLLRGDAGQAALYAAGHAHRVTR